MAFSRYKFAALGAAWLLVFFLTGLSSAGEAAGRAEDLRPGSDRIIVALGDSLTAGLGVPRETAYPARLARRLKEEGFDYRIVDAGVSGDTTSGGLRRIDRVLDLKPEIVILELGANDGLRGLPLSLIEKNLAEMIARLNSSGVRVVIAGMKLPANYGKAYTDGFEAIFPALSKRFKIPLIPFFLEGVATRPELNRSDGIHPNSDGYAVVIENVWSVLKPLLSPP